MNANDARGRLPAIHLLAVAGLLDSGWISARYLTGAVSAGCGGAASCAGVLESSFARVGGVPLAYAGFAGYLALLLCAHAGLSGRCAPASALGLVRWISGTFAAASLLLMGIQFFVLEAFCLFCTISAVIISLIALAASLGRSESRRWVGAAGPVAAALLILPLAYGFSRAEAARGRVVARVGEAVLTEEELEPALRLAVAESQAELFRLRLEHAERWLEEALLARAEASGLARERADLDSLRTAYRAELRLTPPAAAVFELDTRGAHRLGDVSAPVELVVFSDFQCGYCRSFAGEAEALAREFAGQVSVVMKHFPLPMHGMSQPAAEAAECAAEQGAFWAYHDRLFEREGVLEEETLPAIAAQLGLDVPRFRRCLEEGRCRDRVRVDRREGERLGVAGTPMVFLNGRPVFGELEAKRLRAELRRALAEPRRGS